MTKSRRNWKAQHDDLKAENDRLRKAIEEAQNWILQHECHYGISLSCLDNILQEALAGKEDRRNLGSSRKEGE